MKRTTIWPAAILALLLPLTANTAIAADEPTSDPARLPSPAESGNPLTKREDEWRFSIAFPMLWAPDITGKIRGGDPVDFHITFNEILEDLSFGLMFELYANRGPFGLAYRTSYMEVEDERSRTGLIDTRVRTEIDVGVSDLLASFRVHNKVRLVTGLRQVEDEVTLDIFSQIGSTEILSQRLTVSDDEFIDVLVGINLNHWLNSRWGIMLNADVGIAGDNDRDQSIEFRGLYRLGDLNNFWFGYRYLDIGKDIAGDGVTYNVDMSQAGPTLGWAFTF